MRVPTGDEKCKEEWRTYSVHTVFVQCTVHTVHVQCMLGAKAVANLA